MGKGKLRVGAPVFAQGRTTTGWFHPSCFLTGVSVEECSKGNGGKCKLAKGDFRALIRCGSAKFGLSLRVAKRLLQPILKSECLNFCDINGSKILPEKYQTEWIRDLSCDVPRKNIENDMRVLKDKNDDLASPKKRKTE